MKRDEILFLNQLVKSLADAGEKFEEYHKKGDYENFNKSKKMMLRVQEEISKIIR
jgi:hypothetical protein